ncbi:hypothetical protein PLESTB_000449000 [Pleodorina starrii]|uniref:TELO2 ARM repeat domain-containing protein n=1 Tax=Pleodorina starrii TaxID=330485 RepID=A0A9W6BF02_9CHLO|nr:hypothetical protein PLESTM_000671800 [Pleodorina starrii]GLC50942.1 hypothetical protein PLESTB_000449000 [Pleodorina starrii]GLC69863.1 hypothetical protein PLESTF_000889100 [Pleodorina starrii]
MNLEVPIRGLVREACKLADTADDADSIGALASVLHAALVVGDPGASCDEPVQTFKGREGAWQQIRLYLNELGTARQLLGPSAAADTARAIFFWLYSEHWSAVLLAASSNTPLKSRQQQQQEQQQQQQQQGTAPGSRLALLVAALMQLAPAPVLLRSLVSHLSLVTPLGSPSLTAPRGSGTAAAAAAADRTTATATATGGYAVSVTSRGADLAAAFLAQRFAAAEAPVGAASGGDGCGGAGGGGGGGGGGVSELLLHLAAGAVLTGSKPGEQAQHLRNRDAGAQTTEAGQSQLALGQEPGFGGAAGASGSGSGGGGGHEGCEGVLSPEDEAALRHLLLLPPPPPADRATATAAAAAPSRAAAGMYGTSYEPASLAALLVSVPDRAAGLLAAPPPPPLCGGSGLALLHPEVFYWRCLSQLLAALADPRRSVTAALTHLRRRLEQTTAPPLPAPPTEPGGRDGAAAGADGGAAASDSNGVAGGGGGAGGGGEVSAAGIGLLEPLAASAAVGLLAEVLERLAKRGHAAAAADALLACTTSLRQAYDTSTTGPDDAGIFGGDGSGDATNTRRRRRLRDGVAAALAQLADASAAALERLLAALLDRAAAAATALAAGGVGDPAEDGETRALTRQLEQQQRREVQLGLSPPLPPAAAAAALAALSWLLPPRLAEHPAVSYTLSDRLLLAQHRPSAPPPLARLQLLAAALHACRPPAAAAAAAAALAAAWGDAAAVARTSLQRQAYVTQALLYFLARMDRAEVEGAPGLLGGLLAGVSSRLGSPLVASQRQGMRVGRAFSLVLEPGSELFGDMGDLGLGPEELWPGALPPQVQWRPTPAAAVAAAAPRGDGDGDDAESMEPPAGAAAAAAAAAGDEDGDRRSVCTATDSDDEEGEEEDEEEEEEELRPLGSVEEMEGDPEAEAWRRAEPSSLQLRALAAALRKQDDVSTVLGALKRLEEVIRAAPDELGLVAPELVRSLLHCRVPEWADTETDTAPATEEVGSGRRQGRASGAAGAGPSASSSLASSSSSPAAQRRRSLVALLTLAPLPAGDALVPEVYSPHLDLHQRLTLLDALSAAAAELATDPRVAPRLTQGPGGRPLLTRPDPHHHSLAQAAPRRPRELPQPQPQSQPLQGGGQPVAEPGGDGGGRGGGVVAAAGCGRRGGPRTRVWAPAALRKRREEAEAAAAGRPAAGSGFGTFRNRFADVALRWAAGLLREVDRVKHGVDLLGRDHMLLGRLLATLATFAEAAAGSGAMTPLANATLELIRSPQVHAHPEPYVRRASLLAAGQVLAQLPPAAVAGALLGGSGASRDLQRGLLGAAVGGFGGAGGGGGGGGGGLAERLEWVADWCRSLADGDVDPHCRMMAQACVNLQADLASRCLASLQDAAGAAAPLAPTLPSLDLARTARLLASSPAPSLPGGGGGGGGGWSGVGMGGAAAAAALVRDVSAW